VPSTGRKSLNRCAFVFTFKDGLIASEIRLYDFTGWLVQLGVLKAKAV
jgi:ketosteroid isomerase-like protein